MLKRKIYSTSMLLLLIAGQLAIFLPYANAATYTYDSLLRIIMADYENGLVEEYSYDASGNRLTMTVTAKWITGNGQTSSMAGTGAKISVNIKASSLDTALFSYDYAGSGVVLLSSSISGLIIDGGKAVITGECTVNGLPGYSYMATLTDTVPDTVEIEIYNSDGTIHYKTNINILISGDLSIRTEPPDQYHLTTSHSPSNSGSLSPDCSTGCLYDSGTMVTITANENSGYAFNSWSGCDSAANNICTITMDNDKTADALFVSCGNPVRIARGSPLHFSSLQNAYDAAMDSEHINVQSGLFSGDIHLDRDISITLKGGFDCNYYSNSGVTRLDGSMTISNGTVLIEKFVIE